ncbi:hypothetical protein KF840_21650 [bacterium]|nr:hypothetical protein [bacterium]
MRKGRLPSHVLRPIAASSSGHMVTSILRMMPASGGLARTPDLMAATGLAAPTVRRYMHVLQQHDIAAVTKHVAEGRADRRV